MPSQDTVYRMDEKAERWNAKIIWNEFNFPILRNSMHTGPVVVKLARVICVNSSVGCGVFFSPICFVAFIPKEFTIVARYFFPHFHDMYRVFFPVVRLVLHAHYSIKHSHPLHFKRINSEWVEWRLSKPFKLHTYFGRMLKKKRVHKHTWYTVKNAHILQS